jgi:hypothetical protein
MTLEYKGCQNKMHKALLLRRLWKWKLDYYNVHVNHKRPQQRIIFPLLPFFNQ